MSLRPVVFFQSPCLSHVQSEPYSEPPLGDLMEILRFCSLKTKLLNGFALLDLEIKKAWPFDLLFTTNPIVCSISLGYGF